MLFDTGIIDKTMTATKLKKNYKQFEGYSVCTLNSAIQGLRRSVLKEVEARKSRGSTSEPSM